MSLLKILPKPIAAWLMFWLPLAMLAVMPVLSAYLKNTVETSVQDLLLPLGLSLLISVIVGASFFRSYRKNRLTSYLAAIFLVTVLANNYSAPLQSFSSGVRAISPFQLPGVIIELAYLAILAYLAYRLAKWLSDQVAQRHWHTKEIMSAITITISVTFALQFIPAALDIATAWPQYFYQPPKLASAQPTAVQRASKPDIYYIDLEDYASQQTLKTQMGFDNSPFLQFLSDQGFYNAPAASSNYPYTVNSVASTLNANYLSDPVNRFAGATVQTDVPYFNTARNSPVIQQLKSLGYSYDLLGDWYETSNFSPLADHTYNNTSQIVFLGRTYALGEFGDDQVKNSLFGALISRGVAFGKYRLLGYNGQGMPEQSQTLLGKLGALADQSTGGRFIFAQILLPHNYYYYNADGSINPYPVGDNNGELIQQKYTNEIQYLNSQIESLISKIKAKSNGKAIIVLQSDEGPNPGVMNHGVFDSELLNQQFNRGSMTAWSRPDLQMKFGIQAAYYVPGASADDLAAAANPVNIFRLVLNTNFNNQLPYLPLCYFGYAEGSSKPFVYHGITSLVTGTANPSCPQNGNFIKPGPTKLIRSSSQPIGSASDD